MEKYSEYKESGVEWLGEIPSHWNIKRFKNLFSTRTGITFTKAQLEEEGNSVISYGQIHSKDNIGTAIKQCLIRYISPKITKDKENTIFKKGDFLFADTSEDFEGCGNCVYNDSDNLIYAGYHTILAENQNEEIGKYLAYLFSSSNWRGQLRSKVNGVKVYSITQNILKSTKVILPPLSEQKSIAIYLDSVTSQIDEAIVQQQRMINLLNERKQIIINNAVTKGLDPNVPMKDSGVDWIGMIPEHWEKNKIFRLFRIIGSGTTPKGDAFYESGSIPWVNSGDLNNGVLENVSKYVTAKALKTYSALKVYPKNSIIIAMYGASIGKIAFSNTNACTNQACCVLNDVSKDLLLKYAFYALMNCKKNWIEQSTGGTQPNISAEKIKNTWICFPASVEEQQAILISLEHSLEKINKMILRHNDYILLLQERKQIIINEVVTGKIKVS